MVKGFEERLGEILIKKKLLKGDLLKEALSLGKRKGVRLSKVVVDMGIINEKDLTALVSREFDIPLLDLSRYKINPEILALIPKDFSLQHEILPISKMGNVLTVAMSNTLDVFALDDIRSLTGFVISPVMSSSGSVREAVKNAYEPQEAGMEKIAKEIEEAQASLLSKVTGDRDVDVEELVHLIKETPLIKITNALLAEGANVRASDILIEPQESSLRVRYRVDGILHEAKSPPKSMHLAIVSRIKIMSSLNIAERRRPQDGRFKVKMLEREVDFRVSIVPSTFGEKVAIRILDKSQATLDLEKLGLEREPLSDLKKCAQRPYGMMLICGPAGSGKTTTLYSILKYVDTPQKNIITVEDPIEYELAGINQVSVRPEIGLTFALALRSILRQDPNVIMIGEIRDLDTCDIAIKAALTGHLVLSTLHTTSACGSIVRLVNMGVEPFLITSSLICVGAQRLVRRICPKCKEPYKISDAMKEGLRIKIPGEAIFYRGKGCAACRNSGYAGRVGLIEVLVINPQIRELINSKAKESLIFEAARSAGMRSLRENGLEKVLAGTTTIDEVVRVTTGE